MAYIKTTLVKAEKRKRIRIPRFEKTEEWRMMRADIEKGLKPGEVLQILFTEEDMQKYRITNRRTVARYLNKYLVARNLPHAVKSFHAPGGGFIVQVVGGEEPMQVRYEKIRAKKGARLLAVAEKNGAKIRTH